MVASRRRKADQPDAAAAIESIMMPVEQLIPNPRNPRQHPKRQLAALCASIERFGQPRPIVVRRENSMVIAGHGILQAFRQLGRQVIAVRLWDVDQRTADQYLLADNRLTQLSRDDSEGIAALLADVEEAELESMGFNQTDAQIYSSLSEPDKDSSIYQIDTGDVYDQFWVSIHGPLAKQAMVLHSLEAIAKGHDDLEVRIGTTRSLE